MKEIRMKYTDLVEVIDIDTENHCFVAMRLKHNPKLANIVFVYENDNIDAGLHCIYDTYNGHKCSQIYLDVYGAGDLAYILSDLENQYEYAQTQNNGVTDFDINRMRAIKKYIHKSEVNALKSIAKRSI